MTPPQPARVVDGRLVGASFLEDPRVRKIFAIFNGSGEETRVVGGALRDCLIGAPTGEVDFATTAAPDVVASRARAAGLRAIPSGVDHGTITLLVDGAPFEITTLREDVATDGRRAVVRFGRSFREDARRRDFTVNALSADETGRIEDFVGGLADLSARRLRFIGEPRARIREDFLRSLRYLRLQAQLDWIDGDRAALDAIAHEREGLRGLSRERIRSEIVKLLAGRGAVPALRTMAELGVAQILFAGVIEPQRLEAALSLAGEASLEADVGLRLAALAVRIEEDAERLRDRLRLSNAESDRLSEAARALAEWRAQRLRPEIAALRPLLFLRGRRASSDACVLAFADAGPLRDVRIWGQAAADLQREPLPRIPFSGADLVARGLPPGPRIGAILKDFQARWIRAGFTRDAQALARLLEESAQACAGAAPARK